MYLYPRGSSVILRKLPKYEAKTKQGLYIPESVQTPFEFAIIVALGPDPGELHGMVDLEVGNIVLYTPGPVGTSLPLEIEGKECILVPHHLCVGVYKEEEMETRGTGVSVDPPEVELEVP